jgi:Calcineurin-like phosphoesterase
MRTPRVIICLWSFVLAMGLVFAPAETYATASISFTGGELLGKPTNNSITVNIVPDSNIEYHYQYGTSSGVYTGQTSNSTAPANQPSEIVISGLAPNTRYYYRMRYHAPGDAMDDWVVRDEHTFQTQRAKGSTYIFTVTADPHAQFNTAFQQAMQNIKNDQPDFNVDLGDTFITDNTTSQSAVNGKYLAYRNPSYMGAIGPSVCIFLSSGNHENEEGWNFDDTPFSIALASVQARKLYYPTPIPDGFYSGNTDPLAAIDEVTYGDQLREDYYAWEWGDALFVVIDPFQYTMHLPYTPTAGEGTDDSVTGDQWSWTLGEQQFDWFKQTIQNSHAKYKFVFSHQMTGGIPNLTVAGAGPGYVRGGAGAAPYFEWGGKNADGSWGFDAHRPGWGGVPIHQLMVQNGVSAYFHGHDHQFVYEKLDGVVYQEMPSPSMSGSGFAGIYSESDPYTIKILPDSGHLRITVTPSQATVEYVRSNTTGVSYAYTINPTVSTCQGDIEPPAGDGDVDGSDLAAYISDPGDTALEDFAANFGRSDCI